MHNWRKRRRQRGAAMVEAAFVIPVLVALWMAGAYAQAACTAKLDALATARSEAWAYAASNCGTPGDHNPSRPAGVPGEKVSGGASAESLVSSLTGTAGAGGKVMSLFELFAGAVLGGPFPASHASNTRVAKVSSQNGGGLKYSSRHTAQMTVICNEAPYDGNVKSFFRDVFFMVTK